ncbi:MAG: VOC family protein [Bacteroidota bacterium]
MKKSVVHFEIGCNDIQKSVDFHQQVFQWDISPKDNAETINTGGTEAITGHLNKLAPNELQRYVTVYIETDTIETNLEQIEKKGGKILVQPKALPDRRTFTWFEDVAGNTLRLITPHKTYP